MGTLATGDDVGPAARLARKCTVMRHALALARWVGTGAVGDGSTPEEALADLREGLTALIAEIGVPDKITLEVASFGRSRRAAGSDGRQTDAPLRCPVLLPFAQVRVPTAEEHRCPVRPSATPGWLQLFAPH